MVIISLLDTSAIGGAEEYLLSNLGFLASQNHQIVLGTTYQPLLEHWPEAKLMPNRVDIIGDWKGLIKFPWEAWKLRRWFQKTVAEVRDQHPNSPIILFTPGFSDRLVLTPIAHELGLKIVWLEYGPLEPIWKKHGGLPAQLYQKTCLLIDHCITISNHTKKSLVTTGQLPAEEISIVYPGTSLESEKPPSEWLEKHHLAHKKLVVGVGRLAAEKKFQRLIKAWDSLTQADPKLNETWRLLLIGDGPARSELQKQIVHSNLDTTITLTGYLPQKLKNQLLTAAEFFVFPSDWPLEGFGMTTIEAMAHQTAVLTTGAGPQAEIITDQENGLYFDPDNDLDLARKLSSLIQQPKLRKKLATAAQTTVKSTFSAQKMHQKVLKILTKLT